MATFDWRSPDTYKPIQDINAPGFAWEFLRRNPDYRRDVSRIARTTPLGGRADAAFAQRWRLSFRRRSRFVGDRRSCVLAACRDAIRRPSRARSA